MIQLPLFPDDYEPIFCDDEFELGLIESHILDRCPLCDQFEFQEHPPGVWCCNNCGHFEDVGTNRWEPLVVTNVVTIRSPLLCSEKSGRDE